MRSHHASVVFGATLGEFNLRVVWIRTVENGHVADGLDQVHVTECIHHVFSDAADELRGVVENADFQDFACVERFVNGIHNGIGQAVFANVHVGFLVVRNGPKVGTLAGT